MKNLITLITLILSINLTYSQTVSFCDDFESYLAGSPIAETSPDWNSWAELMNGATAPFADDAQVNNLAASSGNNSLYFYSAPASTGGPQDIVLPFGSNPLTTGDFEFNANFYVTTGAYFNFQAEVTPGITWAMDVHMNPTGVMDFTNGGGAINFISTPFNLNTWFNLSVKVDLTNNVWEIYIDNNLQGTFTNTINKIASLDLYPIGGHEFWIDDVCYSHTPAVLPVVNGQILSVVPIEGLSGQDRYPSVEVRNLGLNPINSFDVSIDYNGSIISESISGINLTSLASTQVDFTNSITLLPGLSTATIYVSYVNGLFADGDPTDDTLIYNVNSVIPAAGKLVIGEEATGTWCGWCPRGSVALNWMDKDYYGYFQGIAVHNADPMVDNIYDIGLAPYISGYPSALVDRGPDIDPSAFKGDFLQRIIVAPSAEITNGAKIVSGVTADTLKVSLTVDIKNNITGPWSLACALVEDSVKGQGTQWYQANFYSGGGSGSLIDVDGSDWAQKPGNVPDYMMTYRHVGRAISPGFNGEAMYLQGYQSGDTETHCFKFVLQPDWDRTKIHIVGMFINGFTNMIDNGSSTSIDAAIINGYDAACQTTTSTIYLEGPEDNKVQLYPNPTVGNIEINNLPEGTRKIQVIDAVGKIILETKKTKTIQTEKLSKGIYQIQIITEFKQINRKFIKE